MKRAKTRPIDIIFIVSGSALTALAVSLFLTPARLAPGGVSGIGTILYHAFGFDVGASILVLTAPLLIIGTKLFGRQYGAKSIAGSLLLSLFTTLFSIAFGYDGILDYTKDISYWLSTLYGGILSGIGIGLVMKAGANTGGTDIAAQIIARYTGISAGDALFIVDGLIIAASAFIFGIESALYAIIVAYITSVAVNKVVLSMGTRYAKSVYIISEKLDPIGEFILEEMGRGGTIMDAKGLYTRKSRPMLMTVIPNQGISELTRAVHRIDPDAFMIIQDTVHVLGEGFTPISKIASDQDVTQS